MSASSDVAVPFAGRYRQAQARGSLAFHFPTPVAHPGNPVLAGTPEQDFPDGARYISVLPTAGVLPDAIDAFYAYVGSHDGKDIWLATAPHPLGPWRWHRRILVVGETSFRGHLSSPSAVVHEGQVYLYFHGVMPSGQQPTALSLSQDGVIFKEYQCPVIFAHSNRQNHWYGQSTSYARVIKDGGLFVATFQGNGLGYNVQAPGVTTVAGLAMSDDGIAWRLSTRPLMGNRPGSRGPFAPILLPLWGRWLMLFESKEHPGLAGAVSEGSDLMGPYEDLGMVMPPISGADKLGWPFPVFHEDHLYLLYGGKMGSGGAIFASVIDWRDDQ